MIFLSTLAFRTAEPGVSNSWIAVVLGLIAVFLFFRFFKRDGNSLIEIFKNRNSKNRLNAEQKRSSLTRVAAWGSASILKAEIEGEVVYFFSDNNGCFQIKSGEEFTVGSNEINASPNIELNDKVKPTASKDADEPNE